MSVEMKANDTTTNSIFEVIFMVFALSVAYKAGKKSGYEGAVKDVIKLIGPEK